MALVMASRNPTGKDDRLSSGFGVDDGDKLHQNLETFGWTLLMEPRTAPLASSGQEVCQLVADARHQCFCPRDQYRPELVLLSIVISLEEAHGTRFELV